MLQGGKEDVKQGRSEHLVLIAALRASSPLPANARSDAERTLSVRSSSRIIGWAGRTIGSETKATSASRC